MNRVNVAAAAAKSPPLIASLFFLLRWACFDFDPPALGILSAAKSVLVVIRIAQDNTSKHITWQLSIQRFCHTASPHHLLLLNMNFTFIFTVISPPVLQQAPGPKDCAATGLR